jgi:signal transduction histidine kinase
MSVSAADASQSHVPAPSGRANKLARPRSNFVASRSLKAARATEPAPDDGSSHVITISDRAVTAGRWIAAFTGIISALPATERADSRVASASGLIILLACWRTFRPLDKLRKFERYRWVAVEALVTAYAVGSSGLWNGPFTSSLIVVAVLCGLVLPLAPAAITVITLPTIAILVGNWRGEQQLYGSSASRIIVPMTLGAAVAFVFARRIVRLRTDNLSASGELLRLNEANSLMIQLTNLTRAGGVVRDIRDVADDAVEKLSSIFATSQTSVLLRQDASEEWIVISEQVERRAGSTIPPSFVTELSIERPTIRAHGFEESTTSCLIGPLVVRNEAIGAVVLERITSTTGTSVSPFSESDRQQLERTIEVLGLTLDNSRWFRRLRSLGAEDERVRVARDVHDRLGSAVAYLAFALERLRERYKGDADVAKVHDEARHTVVELRDTLWQLRTGITHSTPLRVLGKELANRLATRTGIHATFASPMEAPPLSPVVELELLRILQEALNNVQRHSEATAVDIAYDPTGPVASLTVTDNGRGFESSGSRGSESYGIGGMRERADAINATLRIDSEEGAGTTITVRIPTDFARPASAAGGAKSVPIAPSFLTTGGELPISDQDPSDDTDSTTTR